MWLAQAEGQRGEGSDKPSIGLEPTTLPNDPAQGRKPSYTRVHGRHKVPAKRRVSGRWQCGTALSAIPVVGDYAGPAAVVDRRRGTAGARRDR